MITLTEPTPAEQVQLNRDVPLPFANQPLGACGAVCAVGSPIDCRSWSDPYGCGGCCACRGCYKAALERQYAPWVWEGDNS